MLMLQNQWKKKCQKQQKLKTIVTGSLIHYNN